MVRCSSNGSLTLLHHTSVITRPSPAASPTVSASTGVFHPCSAEVCGRVLHNLWCCQHRLSNRSPRTRTRLARGRPSTSRRCTCRPCPSRSAGAEGGEAAKDASNTHAICTLKSGLLSKVARRRLSLPTESACRGKNSHRPMKVHVGGRRCGGRG